VQAHLVYHHTSSDQRTSYEANFQGAYNLIRSGKIIHLAKQNLSDDAALIVTYILSLGQVTMRDLHSFWTDSHGNHNPQHGEIENGHRGSTAENSKPQPEIHARREPGRNDLIQILKQLAQSGFVLRSRRAHFHTPMDNYFDAQSELRSLEDGTAAKNRKSQHELERSIMEEVECRNNANITLAHLEGIATGSKRSATEDSESVIRKKTKLTHVAATGFRTDVFKSVPEESSVAVCKRRPSSPQNLT
jgi:DNA-directed RNA polymerase III subunit RPC3